MREFFTDRTPPDIAATYDRLAPGWLSRWSAMENRLVSEQWRNDLVDHLHGDVLELGIAAGDTLLRLGTRPHNVASYTGIDISPGMIAEAQRAAGGLNLPLDLRVGSAEDMGMFPDNRFDTVAASLVFCTIPDVPAALAEVARVLRPDGTFVLVEHVLSPNPLVGWLQKRLAPIQVRQMGCHLDRETVQTLQECGFHIKEERKRILGVFRFIVVMPLG
jgi:ubiquinone/menaquinone biosynthesis C-methylase UbiE